jgi:hypothetical protein
MKRRLFLRVQTLLWIAFQIGSGLLVRQVGYAKGVFAHEDSLQLLQFAWGMASFWPVLLGVVMLFLTVKDAFTRVRDFEIEETRDMAAILALLVNPLVWCATGALALLGIMAWFIVEASRKYFGTTSGGTGCMA